MASVTDATVHIEGKTSGCLVCSQVEAKKNSWDTRLQTVTSKHLQFTAESRTATPKIVPVRGGVGNGCEQRCPSYSSELVRLGTHTHFMHYLSRDAWWCNSKINMHSH